MGFTPVFTIDIGEVFINRPIAIIVLIIASFGFWSIGITHPSLAPKTQGLSSTVAKLIRDIARLGLR